MHRALSPGGDTPGAGGTDGGGGDGVPLAAMASGKRSSMMTQEKILYNVILFSIGLLDYLRKMPLALVLAARYEPWVMCSCHGHHG